MSATYTIANVQHTLQVLKERIPPNKWVETPLPVIAAPQRWLEAARAELGAPEDTELCEIHGCAVIRQDHLPEPVLIDHDGRVYPITPAWSQAQEATKGEG